MTDEERVVKILFEAPSSASPYEIAVRIGTILKEKDDEATNWETEARRLHDLCDEKDAEIARLKADNERLIQRMFSLGAEHDR
jgi:hypothetical protein